MPYIPDCNLWLWLSRLIKQQRQYHLGGFDHIGAVVHTAFLNISMRLLLGQMVSLHQQKLCIADIIFFPLASCLRFLLFFEPPFQLPQHHLCRIDQVIYFHRRGQGKNPCRCLCNCLRGPHQHKFKIRRKAVQKLQIMHIFQAIAAEHKPALIPGYRLKRRGSRCACKYILKSMLEQYFSDLFCIIQFRQYYNDYTHPQPPTTALQHI